MAARTPKKKKTLMSKARNLSGGVLGFVKENPFLCVGLAIAAGTMGYARMR